MSCRKLVPIITRQLSTTTRRQADVVHPGYKEFKLKQEMFQKDDGLPVHLKKGGPDNVLFRMTMLLSVIGVSGSIYSFYRLAFGSKN